jgi:hypothetical protein
LPAAAPARELHALARHAAVDESDLALDVRDPDALVVDGLDERFGYVPCEHSGLIAPNSRRWMFLVTDVPFTV